MELPEVEQLYRDLTAGQPAVLDAAWQSLGAWLYRLAAYQFSSQPALAEECVQEALVDIWRTLGRVRQPAAFGAWCARILNRRIVDARRRQGGARPADAQQPSTPRRTKRVPPEMQVSLEGLLDADSAESGDERLADGNAPPVEEVVGARQLSQEVLRQLLHGVIHTALSENSRTVLSSGFLLQMEDAELAAEMNTSRGNIQVIRHRDLEKLRANDDLRQAMADWLA
jgi:RNA polymerase sigma factor (sigma-70 family)